MSTGVVLLITFSVILVASLIVISLQVLTGQGAKHFQMKLSIWANLFNASFLIMILRLKRLF